MVLPGLGGMEESLEDDSPLAAVCCCALAGQLAIDSVPVEIVFRLKVDVLSKSAGIVTVVTIPVGGFVATAAEATVCTTPCAIRIDVLIKVLVVVHP